MGVAFLASKSGYPVLPVALIGTEDGGIVSNLKRFRRSKIKAMAGESVLYRDPQRQWTRASHALSHG